ncbi:hypothetical protein [Aequorivita capsosiphonis]|nr:hypothetical protein [Aequorivita capsosiphonis]
MDDKEDGFDKKRDHNQYGEVEKDENEQTKKRDLPKSPNKGTQDKS